MEKVVTWPSRTKICFVDVVVSADFYSTITRLAKTIEQRLARSLQRDDFLALKISLATPRNKVRVYIHWLRPWKCPANTPEIIDSLTDSLRLQSLLAWVGMYLDEDCNPKTEGYSIASQLRERSRPRKPYK